jgi:NADPH:quinone reductase
MRALVSTGQGATSFEVATVPEPDPASDTALVEVRAVSVNRGELSGAAVSPAGTRFGWDLAGVVLRAAADGTGPAAGTRVVGLSADRSAWAERVEVPTGVLAPLPADVTDEQAAALPVAGLTAFQILDLAAPLLGRTVLVTGAGGGVGRFAVQLAALGGASVVALVGSAARGAGLEELGASRVATYESEAQPVDAVLEGAGGDVFPKALAWLRPGGRVVVFGNSARTDQVLPLGWSRDHPGAPVRFYYLLEELTRRSGSEDLALLVRLVEERRLDPQVSLVTGWANAEPALQGLHDRQLNGKVVLTIR